MEDFLKSKTTSRDVTELYAISQAFTEDRSDASSLVVARKKSVNATIQLNSQQLDMVSGIREFLTSNKDKQRYYLVQGVGGSGKTTTIKEALRGFENVETIVAAPSHFAKNVIHYAMDEAYKVTTIASLLDMVISYDDDGKEILMPKRMTRPPVLSTYKIVVIDEASMITDDVADKILERQLEFGFKLILLGDFAQLPPVGQSTDCKLFDNIAIALTISMRFNGPIGVVANALRGEIEKLREGLVPSINIINHTTDRASVINTEGTGYVFLNNRRILLTAALKRFKMQKGKNYVRVIAFRNRVVTDLNKFIRVGLYGDSPAQFEIGELVINKGGVFINMRQVISNGDVLIVETAREKLGPYTIPSVLLTFKDRPDIGEVLAVSEAGMEMYEGMLQKITNAAKNDKSLWAKAKEFKSTFAHFNYSYACTTHNAQGSSIKYVFVLEDDILSVKPTTVKEKLQSLYVAFSRASFRLYIYNKNFKVNNDGLEAKNLKIEANE